MIDREASKQIKSSFDDGMELGGMESILKENVTFDEMPQSVRILIIV